MVTDLHPKRDLINRMIFPDYKTFLNFNMGHGHDYHRGSCRFIETSKSSMFRRIRPTQGYSLVFTFLLINDPMVNIETTFWKRCEVAVEKDDELVTAINSSSLRNMNLAGSVVGCFQGT